MAPRFAAVAIDRMARRGGRLPRVALDILHVIAGTASAVLRHQSYPFGRPGSFRIAVSHYVTHEDLGGFGAKQMLWSDLGLRGETTVIAPD